MKEKIIRSRLSDVLSGELLKQSLLGQGIDFLIVLLEMFHVLRMRKWIAFQILQIITSSIGVTDDLVWSFPSRP